MNLKELKYTEEHEWIGDGGATFTVGITAHAAEQLGDITYVELPEIGLGVGQGDETGAVESVKAVSDIYAPVSGRVSEVNDALEEKPELVNENPYDAGWFYKLSDVDAGEYGKLMDAAAYEQFLKDNEE